MRSITLMLFGGLCAYAAWVGFNDSLIDDCKTQGKTVHGSTVIQCKVTK